MGVPSFYRWLSKKYPKVVVDVVEEKAVELPNGQKARIDTSKPNPNGFEIDNLYLDMNGIIHPCCHPEDGDAPNSEDEMMQRVFLYIDRIFAMARPRKVLYMAIDGVAPRAKMNQQRSRRFRAAKEVTDKEVAEEELRKEWMDKGMKPPPKRPRAWDSNVITPGTPFMAKLSRALHWYIFDRLSHDIGWRGCKVIFSDAKVPGEGEHKIMQFIRRQRASPGYNPNTRHCLYGMDADLIMLGLATHDPHFMILRETVTFSNPAAQGPRCFMCGVVGHRAEECSGIQEEEKAKALASGAMSEPPPEPGLWDKPFQFLMLNVLREYLASDLYVPNLPFAWDLERAIDDFVFLLFFVGNDFLPHLPLLEIREGAIERLVGIYKRLLPSLGGYISEDAGTLNLSRIDVLLTDLGLVEDSIFKSRKSKEDYFRRRDENRSAQLATRRQKTIAARESAQRFADQQGYTAVATGIKSGPLQPHIAAQVKKEGQLKAEIVVDDMTGAAPIYDASKLVTKGTKRKSAGGDGEKADAPAPSSSPVDTSATKKSKLVGGGAKPTKTAADKGDDEDELDSDDDPSDPTFKPSAAAVDDDDSMSSSDSDDDEVDKKRKRKAKKRKAKQAAKKLKVKQEAADTAAAAAVTVKQDNEPMVDNLAKDSTGKKAAALDAQAAELDFGALLNAKLRKQQRAAEGKKDKDSEKPDGSDESDEEERDPVRFGEEGWKPRYYASKMSIDRTKKEDGVVFHKLFKSYAEGLAWVMKYYYQGCASWSWYYPFHYAPMASDLGNLDRYKIEFEPGQPFKPIGQLMGVLPGKSAHALPVPCQELMVNPLSPIIDFYPEQFALDLNGQKALWKAVALLPWIEEKRLLEELRKVEPQFTPEEKDRNSLGVDYLFVHKSHLLANSIFALYNQFPPEKLQGKTPLECSELHKEPIDITESDGMNGFLSPYVPAGELDGTLASEIGLESVEDIAVMSAVYTDPPQRPHVCQLLPGLIPPKPTLVEADFDESARGGTQQRDTNQSRSNQQRYANQRDSNRQLQGVHGGSLQPQQTHGGQALGYDPRFGAAPSHFQQGDVSTGRIWSSGFNARQQPMPSPSPSPSPRPYQQQGQYPQSGYYQQQAQYQQGYYQQQSPQPYQQVRSAYSPPAQQQGYYQQAPQQQPLHYPPPSPQPYQHTAPAQPQQPRPHSFSHARAAPAAGNNQHAALQAQIQAATAAQRAMQQQRQQQRR